jgi:hypothetical protein
MAGTPAFAATVRTGFATVNTANTARDGTGTIATVLTAGASGTKVDEISIVAQDNPADSIVNIFLHDGTTARYFDAFDMADPAAGSAVLAPYRESRAYANLEIPSGWSLRASITAAPTAGLVGVFAFAADF